ncbi:MAG: hypothetical protein KGN74_13725 [Gemmatimonadota bacterium]|nr:hypothetical protein [Gemmatimonadota bacterium]
MSERALPAGYERLVSGRTEAVAVPALVPLLRDVLAAGSLYDFARARPGARELTGRQPAYAFSTSFLDGALVVRHNRHGGALARITGDRFLYPTRAPHELDVSVRLSAAGVPTPPVLAYVIYGRGLTARADVATRLADPAADLAAVLAGGDGAARVRALDLTATLVAQLARAGALHADLNAKNVLVGSVAPGGADVRALVLDVDRVTFGWATTDALAHNLARLDRSLRKRRARFDEAVTDEEIARLARSAAERA